VSLTALALAGALFLTFANTARADLVTTIPMGAAAQYAVLGGQGVTNTGATTMHLSVGSSPNPAVSGFPPGVVTAPGSVDIGHAAAGQASLGTAYDNAHGRDLTATVPANLSGQTLQGGVYAGTAKAPLLLPGVLTLDGNNNPNTVFIFQTDSSLTTGSASRVSLINGAQECNVFWQVLSSADLGSGSTFVGNIFALTSIVIRANVTYHGRALARNGSVTMINDHFSTPTCATELPPTTTTALPGAGAPTTVPGGGSGGVTTTIAGGGGALPTLPGTGGGAGGAATTTTLGLTVGILGPPRTGVAPLPASHFPWPALLLFGVAGAATTGFVVRRRLHAAAAPPNGR
jgi:hypothetical protein